MRYGDPALATCHALVPSTALGWNSTVEPVDMEDGAAELNWTVDEMREWSVESRCVITMEDGYECSKELPIIVYSETFLMICLYCILLSFCHTWFVHMFKRLLFYF